MDTLTELVAAVLCLPAEAVGGGLSRMSHRHAWTSLRHVELMVSVEERYGVSLTAAEMSAVESVDDLRRLLAAKHAQH